MAKPDALMPFAPQAPKHMAPHGAVDAHVHMLAGKAEFPLWENRAENPAPGPTLDGWIALLEEHLETLGMTRAVIVHSILFGPDNSVTLEALRRLDPNFRGVGLLPDGADAAAVDALDAAQIDAVRLNYVHGGVLSWEGARAMAPTLADRGMHIQMLMHVDRHIDALAADIRTLPVPLVIDHIGWPSHGLAADGTGVDTLCDLLADGHVWIKLSALYRLCDAPYDAANALVQRLINANPARCLWGSDWPHLMLNGAKLPHSGQLLDAFDAIVPDDATRTQILCQNPVSLFRF